MTIEPTWGELQQMAGEFFRTMPALNYEEADDAFKCLTLGYLGMQDETPGEQYQSELLMQIAAQKMLEKEFEYQYV